MNRRSLGGKVEGTDLKRNVREYCFMGLVRMLKETWTGVCQKRKEKKK